MRSPFRVLAVAVTIALTGAGAAHALKSFIEFESGPVRPLALSPDGTKLFAANTPDNRLEIFDVDVSGISYSGSVAVGMEPVAVAARSNTEVWVVNHLSDSISIVDSSGAPRVIRTLLVGDEPSDIVFAGTGGNRAFITTAHRGQNTSDPGGEYDVVGAGRADVWVFDATALGTSLGGTPIEIVNLFSDKPRALAVSADGSTVYAAAFHSGNRTTAINEGMVCNTTAANVTNNVVQPACTINSDTVPGGLPLPHKNHQGNTRPETGLIVKQDRDGGTSGQWQDELGRDWSSVIRFDLPDEDVFAISANTNPPAEIGAWSGVGTVLFNMVTNPVTGKVYVSNTDARNEVRFEGPGTFAAAFKPPGEPASVRGRLGEARITVIDGASVTPRHLNKHIVYSAVPQPASVKTRSLATPLEMAISPNGATLYVAAFGSKKIGVFSTSALEANTFTPDANTHITLSGGGPCGLVLAGTRLYTLTRFNNSVVVIDLTQGAVGAEVQRVRLHNPEPRSIIDGRPFLYDAQLTGSNGEASCSSCHIFGDMDDLAWDLGDPDGNVASNGNPFTVGAGNPFHPMKGPMATQSLRGLVNMGPQHWRGDRQGNSVQAFNAFNVAFPGLIGRDEGQFSAADMQKFTNFTMELTYPPNPVRLLDNSLRSDELAGFTLYNGRDTDVILNCNGCHTLDPANGFFGGNGNSSIEGETQEFKIPHLRNAYQKIGMFGMPFSFALGGDFTHQGPQIRGFGYLHDGSIDSLFRFLSASPFSLDDTEQANIEAMIVAFDSDLPPMVGQQITRTSTNAASVNGRIDEIVAAAGAPFSSKLLGPGAKQCDVVIKGVFSGGQRGGLLVNGNQVELDDGTIVSESSVRTQANTAGQEKTYTCVPFGSGERIGIDRDADDFLDGLDNCPDVFNPLQTDVDTNDVGDVCEGASTTTTTLGLECGNGIAQAGEECDGFDLGGASDCQDLGHVSGALSCNEDCTYDISHCTIVRGAFVTRTFKVSGLTKPPFQQKASLTSSDLNGAGVTFFIPAVEAFVLSVGSNGTPLDSSFIPANDPGWTVKANGYKWKASKTSPHPDGLTSVTVGKSGQPFRVKVKSANINGTGVTGFSSLDFTVQLGNDVWTGTAPPCALSSSGSTFSCR